MTISVLIPTYGRLNYLAEALESVAKQSRLPDEVVVSDNHPTISCKNIVDQFTQHLPVIRVSPGKSLTMDAHWIWAFRQTKSEYTALLEDDNLWRPNHLEALQQGALSFPDALIIGSCAKTFTDPNAPVHGDVFAPPWKVNLLNLSPKWFPPQAALGLSLTCNLFASSAIMVKTNAVVDILPMNSNDSHARDRLFWAMFAAVNGAVFVPETTVLYREHSNQAVKGISVKNHRKISAEWLRATLEVINKRGFSISECFKSTIEFTESGWVRQAGKLAAQTRDQKIIMDILPHIPGGMSYSRLLLVCAWEKLCKRINDLIY